MTMQISLYGGKARPSAGPSRVRHKRGRRAKDPFSNPIPPPHRSPSMGSSNNETLHHKCAIKARFCWGLWNEGHPVTEVVNHYPQGEDYLFDLGIVASECIVKNANNRIQSRRLTRPTGTQLAIFLVELLRLEKVGLFGDYGLALVNQNLSFNPQQRYIGKRLMLIPVLEGLRGGSESKTDVVALAKTAATIAYPNLSTSLQSCQTIEEILGHIPHLELRKDKKATGPAKLVIRFDGPTAEIFLVHQSKTYGMTPNPNGYWMFTKPLNRTIKKGIDVPITLVPYPAPEKVNAWIDRGLCWKGDPRIWMLGKHNALIRNTVGTLAAEWQHSENSCYEYKMVEHDLVNGMATLRVECRDGSSNAHDLWETCTRAREMNVALNSDPSVFNWKQDEEWNIESIDDKDPYLLTVRSLNQRAKLRETGFLKRASVPHRALMLRKDKLVRKGILNESIRTLFNPSGKKELTKSWRLSRRNKIMALQGPPGTGKTWTACQIIIDLLEENPYSRIIVSCKEHLALDHLTNRIRESLDPSFDVVRICKNEKDSERELSADVLPKTISERILGNISIPPSEMQELGRTATWVDELALRTSSVVCTTTLDQTMEHLQQGGISFDFAIIEEAGKSYPSELIGPLSIARETLLIGDHMQLPPFELEAISKSVEKCFTHGIQNWHDRNHKDTINRLLVETSTTFNSRGSYDLKAPSRGVVEWLQPFQFIHKNTSGDTLQNQWRMFKSLSEIIGRVFYNQNFAVRKENNFRNHTLPGVFGKYQQRLLMIDAAQSTEGRLNKSFSNTVEAKIAARHLTELLQEGLDAIAITPYRGQVAEIRSHLAKEHHHHVRTVDGFQGKEADFIILSLVRNNKRTGSARRWGFFRDPRRINVALSRSREGLLIISSKNHILNTDWNENEGQLVEFVNSIEQHGQIISGG